MLRRAVRVAIKVAVIVTALLLIALLMRDSSDRLATARYDVHAPIETKLKALSMWLPEHAELVVVVDPQQLLAKPDVQSRLAARLAGASEIVGIDAALIVPQLARTETIGLVAVALTLKSPDGLPEAVFVVQGEIDRNAVVGSVDRSLAEEGDKLERTEIEGVTIYSEYPRGSSFAFAFPDAAHMVVGLSSAIEELIHASHAPTQRAVAMPFQSVAGAPLFGWLAVTERLKKILPPELAWLTTIRFSSDADLAIRVTVPTSSSQQHNDLKLFLEGLRASYLITGGSESKLNGLLLGTDIASDGAVVTIDIPLQKVL